MKVKIQGDFTGQFAARDIKIENCTCRCWWSLRDADRTQLEAMKGVVDLERRTTWRRFVTHPSVVPHLVATFSFAFLLLSAPWTKPWLRLLPATVIFSLAIAHVFLCGLAAWYMQYARRPLQHALTNTKALLADIEAALVVKGGA